MTRLTVIARCYNHAAFVEACIASVRNQSYLHYQLIIVDDASTDGSVSKIRPLLKPGDIFLPFEKNQGICRSFNLALAHATGDFVIDLATDDCLLPDTLAQYAEAIRRNPDFFVFYGDMWVANAELEKQHRFYELQIPAKFITKKQTENVFEAVIRGYTIASPTLMIMRELLLKMGGYDETLVYEDFDLLLKLSRNERFCFINRPLIVHRTVQGSDASKQTQLHNEHLSSTVRILEKTLLNLRNNTEKQAFLERLRFTLRLAWFTHNFGEATNITILHTKLAPLGAFSGVVAWCCEKRIPVNNLYVIYTKCRKFLG